MDAPRLPKVAGSPPHSTGAAEHFAAWVNLSLRFSSRRRRLDPVGASPAAVGFGSCRWNGSITSRVETAA
uniref:Uncharacterized protein n=1 Tax=Setaria italica TaxID=4555 RepID=K3XP09_SETIT